MTHDFQTSLAYSHEQEDAPWWREVYTQAFPTLQAMTSVRNDGWAQRGGIDRLLTLSDGTVLKVDEKVRRQDWPDIALERWSDFDRRVPGWVKKPLTCDYIAYALVPSQTCYLLPFQLLRRAWDTHEDEWMAKGHRIEAQNRRYTTVSYGVPTRVVLDAIRDCLVVTWGNSEQRQTA